MAHFNHQAEKKVLNVLMFNAGITAFAPYLGLFSAAPTDNTAGTEVTGNAYARQAITSTGATDNGASSGAAINNSVAILFPAQTPAVWVPVAWGIFDASTAGNLWWWETFTFPTYNIGDQVQIAIAALSLTLD